MAYNVTLIPGDGTGPEITEATRRVLEATGVPFNWDVQRGGTDIASTSGTPLSPAVIDSIRETRVALKGPTAPIGAAQQSVTAALCQEFDLHPCPSQSNRFGGVLVGIGAGFIRGACLTPSANIGENIALFEPAHGSAAKYAGMNKVNPMAMMLAGVLMLHHLNEHDAANRLEKAIADLITEGKTVTYDLKPDRNDPTAVGTSQVADGIVAKLKAR